VPKRYLAAATAALGLAASTVVASATPASADVPCTITGITPTSVAVGIYPVTKKFGVRTSDCGEVQSWNITDNHRDSFMYVYDSGPYEAFGPSSNSEAGPHSTTIEVSNGDYYATQRTINGFSLKRYVYWQGGTFNASPEPVRKGKPVTLKGRLLVANWDTGRWQAARVVSVKVQFRTPNGSYKTVKSGVRTSSSGWVNTTVTAKQTGVWRLVYGGNSTAGSATTSGDSVKLK